MEKNSIKINLLTFFLIAAVIIIVILLAVIYVLDGKVKDEQAKRERGVIEYSIGNNESSEKEKPQESKEPKEKFVIDTTDKNIKYKDYLKKDNKIDGLYVTEAIKNNDETYTLRGVGVKEYSFDKKELERKFEEDGTVSLFGKEFIVSKPEENDEDIVYELKVNQNKDPEFRIVKINEEEYKLERLAQYSRVDTFDTSYFEVTIPEDMVITVGNEFSGEESTVKDQFEKYKTIKLQLTEKELSEKLLEADDYINTYTFKIEDDEIKTITQDLLGA